MTAVYLAGPYAARELLHGYAANLRDAGLNVTASWIDETHDITPGTVDAATELSDAEVAKHAATDLRDIAHADRLVLITGRAAGLDVHQYASGGRHVETGFAIACGIPVLVVGEPENVFHRMGTEQGVTVVSGWGHAMQFLTADSERLPVRGGRRA